MGRQASNPVVNDITKFDKCAQLKVDLNRASCLIDMSVIENLMDEKIPVTRTFAYMIFAFLFESGIIKFTSGRGRVSKDRIVAGIDQFRLNPITTSRGIRCTSSLNKDAIFFPFAMMNNPSLIDILHGMTKFLDKSSSGSVVKLNKPATFGLEEKGVIKFDKPELAIIYELGRLLDKLNEGDFGISNVAEAITEHLKKRKRLTMEDIQGYIKQLESVISQEQMNNMINAKDNSEAISIPDINPNMKPYGYQWKCINWGMTAKRGVIAYDLGLGKTLICILISYLLKKMGRIGGSIIFTRLSIIPGFEREIKKIWPAAKVVRMAGTQNERFTNINEARDADFVLCSYGPLSRQMPEMMSLFLELSNYALFFDEGGSLRNKNIMKESAQTILENREYAFILDATPFPNNVLIESFNLIDLMFPNQLGTMRAWRAKHSDVEEVENSNGNGTRRVVVYKEENMKQMQKEIAPFIFVKSVSDPDVDAQLPPGIREIDELFDMGPTQAAWYQAAVNNTLDALVDYMRKPDFKAASNILAALMRQRQAAVWPGLIDPGYNGDHERLDLIVEKTEQWINKSPDKGVLIGAFFTSVFPKLKSLMFERMGDKINDSNLVVYSGDTNLNNREEIEKDFNSGKIRVILASFGAAGRGLNIQHNCYRAIITHKVWNPDIIRQFKGRIYRQGQKHRVTIYNLIAHDSIDEHIEDVLFRKEYEQTAMLNGNELRKAGGQFTLSELAGMAGVDTNRLRDAAMRTGFDIDNNDITIKVGNT